MELPLKFAVGDLIKDQSNLFLIVKINYENKEYYCFRLNNQQTIVCNFDLVHDLCKSAYQ